MLRSILSTLALFALVAGCQEKPPPDIPPGGGGDDFNGGYADTIFSYTEGGTVQDCATELVSCEEGSATQCGPIGVLGMPDDITWTLMPGDQIVVAFRCTSIREVGGVDTPDMKLWATFQNETASATVSVSVAGTDYEILDVVNTDDPQLDLGRVDLEVVQFVQIVSTGSSEVYLDAVEALPPAMP
jgi:hypothetical protein